MQGKLQDGSIIISGVLGNDAEYKTVGEKNSSLTKFSVKVGETDSTVVDQKPKAIWANCQCWHTLARATARLKKGDSVLCVGKIETHEYNGKDYKTLNCSFVVQSMCESSVSVLPTSETVIENTDDYEVILDDSGVPF